MKHQRLAKIFGRCLLSVAITSAVLVGQNPNPPSPQQPTLPPGPRGQAPPPQPGPRSTAATPAPETFFDKAVEINEAEVQLGQLANTKAQSDRVKTYAQMLVKDHSAALQKLQRLQTDSARNAPALSVQHQELKTRLSGLNGAAFDHAYIDAMVMGHRDAVKLFEQEIAAAPSRPQPASKPTDAEVTTVAKELLPTIKSHLEEAEKIQKTLK
jgi:putative membrane protein